MNPNGLPDPNHYSSPRDMAVLGRALLLNFPQYAGLFDIGAMKLGDQVIPNHNGLLGRYPGADGMKTGFTCAAGFNLVASATRGGRKVIVVIMGDLTAKIRTAHAADLLDRAFASSQVGELADELPPVGGAPPDMHAEICGGRSPKAVLEAENEDFNSPIQATPGATAQVPREGATIAALPRPVFSPTPVYVGEAPGYKGPIAGPRPANTPIGAIAYTAPQPEHAAASTPLQPDPNALPMDRGGKKQHAAKHAGAGKKKAKTAKKLAKKKVANKTADKKAPAKKTDAKKPPAPSRTSNPRPNRRRKNRARTFITPAPATRRPGIERLAPRPASASAHPCNDPDRVPRRRQDNRAQQAAARPRSGAIRRSHQRIRRDRPRPSVCRKSRRRHGHVGLRLPVLHLARRFDRRLGKSASSPRQRTDCAVRPAADRNDGIGRPAPILHTLMSHPYLLLRFRLDGVVTVLDAINVGAADPGTPIPILAPGGQMADLLLFSKTDLIRSDAENRAFARLLERLERINPGDQASR